jgi:hypothetical protein
MDEESSGTAPFELDGATRANLARSVRRATEASIPVAVVDLLGPGQEFTPSRGKAGAWYRSDEIAVRDLGAAGAGGLAAGIALYPPPGSGTERVIVLPLERRNWLPYEEALERVLAELVAREEQSRGEGSPNS